MKTIRVVAAVIADDLDHPTKILATERGYGEFKGQWEFPGGKIEKGETPEVAQLVTNSSEKVTLDSSTTGATLIPMQLSSQSILYLSGLSADARVNLTHSSSASLNTVLSIGECVTITVMIRNSATAYLFKELQIDSVIQTLRWMDGTAPSAATASGTDVYSFTILKTASAAYEVLGSAASYK